MVVELTSEPHISGIFGETTGEVAGLIATFDWSRTPIGARSEWPSCLRVTVATLLESGLPMVLLWGQDGTMIYNDAYTVFAGGRHPSSLGGGVREMWPELADFNANVLHEGLAGRKLAYRNQPLVVRRSGVDEDIWLDLDYTPVRDEAGSPMGVLAVVIETTEKIRTATALRRSEQRYRDAFEASGVMGLWRYDISDQRFTADTQFARLYGLDAAELASGLSVSKFLDSIVEDDRQRIGLAIRGALESHSEFFEEYRIAGKDGSIRWVLARGKGYPEDDTSLYATGIAVDITPRKTAELELARLNETLEQQVAERTRERDRVWQTSQDLFVVCGMDGYYIAVNPAWAEQLGYDPGDLVGARFDDFAHPDDEAANQAAFDRIVAGEAVRDVDFRLRAASGEYSWYSWTCIPDGDQFYGTGRNIDTRRTLEDQLRQAQKMEAVGQLTGGIAHDFNNLLAGITGSLELVKLRIAQGRSSEIERYLDAAAGSASRAAALTHRLLAFSRRQTLDPKPVGLNRLVQSLEDLVRRTVGPGIETEIVAAGGLWTTLCDANQIENALLNLSINARDAMPDGGRLTIETANVRLDDAYAASQAGEVRPGQYVALCVTDTGTGMPTDVMARAFDPFFTTKPLGQGTGLGLSMIYGFVKQSGGHVGIYSEIGQGTTVKLYLPRHAGEIEGEAAVPDLSHAIRAETSHTVLVVDDEPVVRMLILEVLEELGYGALEAGDGPAGLKLLQDSQAIDLLITDVGLPGGMNGRQLADAARQVKPDLRILFITGYAENAAIGNGMMDIGMEVMSKPFAMEALATKLGTMLDR